MSNENPAVTYAPIALRSIAIGAAETDDHGRRFVPIVGLDPSGNPWTTFGLFAGHGLELQPWRRGLQPLVAVSNPDAAASAGDGAPAPESGDATQG